MADEKKRAISDVRKIRGAEISVVALNDCLSFERTLQQALLTMAREVKDTHKVKKLADKLVTKARSHEKTIWALVKRIADPLLRGEASMEFAPVEWDCCGDTVAILTSALDLLRSAHDKYEEGIAAVRENGDTVTLHYYLAEGLAKIDRDIMWFAAQLRQIREATVGDYQVEWMKT